MLGSWVDSGLHGVLAVLTATQRQFVAVTVTVGLFGLVVVLSFLRSRTPYGDSRPSNPSNSRTVRPAVRESRRHATGAVTAARQSTRSDRLAGDAKI